MENQIKAAFLFPPPLRIQVLLSMASLEQKEIAVTHGKSPALISAVIRHNYPSTPAKQGIFNTLTAKLPLLKKICPDYQTLFNPENSGGKVSPKKRKSRKGGA